MISSNPEFKALNVQFISFLGQIPLFLHFFYRAVKFNRGMRKLGLMPDGVSTYLDRFRFLITHIGNALGFVRMLNCGGILHSADIIKYIPDINILPGFESLVESSGLEDPDLRVSANLLDQNLEHVAKSFKNQNSFFRLLVGVFSKQLCSGSHLHLANFWVILPSLFINFVEYLMICKENLSKNNVDGARISDDGFSIGNIF